MPQQIYVNLPVKNLDRSVAFFKSLGYAFNPQFTDANAACMIVSESIYVMLLVEPFFTSFTKKAIADVGTSSEVILALSCESKAAVDAMVAKASAAGATTPIAPQDHGFMYQHGYHDLDGHQWEVMWMDESKVPHHLNG
jgi:predicted lactoylglutathione lyase